MAATKLKLAIKQGATFRRRLTWKTGTPALPVDITGYVARMQFRVELPDIEVLFELTTENGGLTLGGVAGTIDLYISAADTTLMTWETAVFDLEMVQPGVNGDVIRLVEGTASNSFEVTR